MNFEQAKRQAELVYEANVHLGEAKAQRLYDETLFNLMADADDADAADLDADAVAWLGARVAARVAEKLWEAADADYWQRLGTKHVQRQITDYSAWAEYVDPQGVVSEEQFHKMTFIEKLIIIQKVFGADATYTDNSADADAADTASVR